MTKCIYVILGCIALLSPTPSCSQPPNTWTVVAVRERRPGEVPFEEVSRYLRPSPDANNVPGPDSLVACVRNDKDYHPYVWLEDLRTGESIRLIDAWASLPQWSPDGKYISCVVWKSMKRPHELTIVDVATRTVLTDPEVRASGTTTKWSPDSRTLAAAGVIHARPNGMLYTVTVPDGAVTVIDTLEVLADYEFSWSPDGRWIAFSRPTKLDQLSEDPIEADLWIADAKSGKAWPVLQTPEWVEANPLWITDSTIQLDRVRWAGDEPGAEQRVVIELSPPRRTKD